jgi:galactokinase
LIRLLPAGRTAISWQAGPVAAQYFSCSMIELNGVRDALATLTANAPRFYRAPGRLNLIGDHVDYSEGFVLPIAIDRLTVLAAAKRNDRIVRIHSLARGETVEFDLDDTGDRPRGAWNDDLRRVALGLERRGATLRGSDLAVRTTIPERSGLASSASLGLAGALALLGTAGVDMPVEDVVAVCREVDGEVAPIASAMGKRDHALLIDCRSAEATTVPLVLNGVAIVVCDAHVARDRRAIERDRRSECDAAAKTLRTHLRSVKTLRDVSLADFLRLSEKLPPLLRRRTRHVVTENVRVLQTVAAIRAEDPIAIGGRLNESHDSLRDDYDLSSPEVDVLVGAARSVPGVFGTRMTGRSNATVSLVRRDALPAFRATVGTAYRSAFGREPAVLEVRAADGASIIG